MDSTKSRRHARELEAHLNTALLRKPKEVRLLLSALISGGHALIEDRPGVGKTTVARAFAKKAGLGLQRIQGTADLLPTDITGVHVYNMVDSSWQLNPGPVLAPVVLFDELNRATPKAQSALLEAMAEGTVTIDGETLELPDPHLVIATQNPTGGSGTFPLVDAQRDRFAVVVSFGPVGRKGELSLLDSHLGASVDQPVEPLRPEALKDIRAAVNAVTASGQVKEFLLNVVDTARALDDDEWLSSRVPLDMLSTAKGHAYLSGRSYVAPDDIVAVAFATIRHRLGGQTSDDLLHAAIDLIDIPEAA